MRFYIYIYCLIIIIKRGYSNFVGIIIIIIKQVVVVVVVIIIIIIITEEIKSIARTSQNSYTIQKIYSVDFNSTTTNYLCFNKNNKNKYLKRKRTKSDCLHKFKPYTLSNSLAQLIDLSIARSLSLSLKINLFLFSINYYHDDYII